MDFEERIMRIAIKLAKKGRTSPNPKVGAVLVKDGKIIGKGYHRKAGLAHAEIEAINSVRRKDEIRGAELYVTLEPCSHLDKRTPPCTRAIVESGVKKVVCAFEDPNPKVSGIEELKRKGIEVEVGVLKEEAERGNKPYVKRMLTGFPYVTMKVGMSADGKIATNSGENEPITSGESNRLVHRLRNENAGIMVGIGTVLKDDPRLTCRIKGGKDPVRIVVDSELKIPLNARVLENADGMVIIGASERFDAEKKEQLEGLGVKVIITGEERVNLRKLMKEVAKLGIDSILLEGGSELNASMIEENLVDRFLFFVAPVIIGGSAKGAVGGKGIFSIADAYKLEFRAVKRVGGDILIEAYPQSIVTPK